MPGEMGRINTEVVDTEPTLIATSLSNYWQDIFRNTTGAHTPYSRIVNDYPADMCVPEAAQAAVGADVTEEHDGGSARSATAAHALCIIIFPKLRENAKKRPFTPNVDFP
eukprot:COSAG06_NODE_301_length_17881_cov_19.286976_4_plen_110_part_00